MSFLIKNISTLLILLGLALSFQSFTVVIDAGHGGHDAGVL